MADKEYIEREALIESIRNGAGTNLQKFFAECCALVVPAADVIEVRHGEWKDRGVVKRANTENAPIVACSECQITFCDLINNHHFMYRYCPYCGAKMDGERKEQT